MKKALKIISVLVLTLSLSVVMFACGKTPTANAVTGVSLNKTSATLSVGEQETLVATVKPENADNKAVTWASDKEAVATVGSDGKVTAVAPGVAKITVKTADGEHKATCTVTVKAPEVAVTGIKLNKTSETLIKGATLKLVATVEPESATDKTVVWASDNKTVATVSADGKVSALATGSAKITATCGGFSAECAIMVAEKAITGIEIEKEPTKTIYSVGDTFEPAGVIVMAKYNDNSKSDVTGECTFTPSGALAKTDTEITVNYGTFSTKISITVNEKVSGVALAATEEEFRTALANGAINKIAVTTEQLTFAAALEIGRDITVDGNIAVGELSVAAGKTLTVNGIVDGKDSLTVGGKGSVVLNGSQAKKAYLKGGDITIGEVNLTINSVYAFTSLLDSSAIYATGSLTITQEATVVTHSNVYSAGAFKLDQGANLTIYGVGANFDSSNVDSAEANMIGNALQSETSIEVYDVATRLTIMCAYDEQIETAAISTTNGADIVLSEATILIDKNPTTGYAFGYGIWAGHACWLTNRVQATFNVYRVGLGGACNQNNSDIVIEHKKDGEPLPDEAPYTTLTVTTVDIANGTLFELGSKSKGWVESVVTLNGVVVDRTDN